MNLVDHLKKENVILEGHFKLRSGKHSNLYVNKDAIYCNPVLFPKVITQLLDLIQEKFDDFDVITGPAIAGAILAAPLSLVLHKTFVYPEKTIKKIFDQPNKNSLTMDFKRGYDKIIKGKKILLAEDVITTGNSILQTKDAVEKYGGTVVGSVVIWNRIGDDNILNMKIHSLIKEKVNSWKTEDCPICLNNVRYQQEGINSLLLRSHEPYIPLTDPKTGEIIDTISVGDFRADSVENRIIYEREHFLKNDVIDHPDDIVQEEENTITEEKIVL